MKSHHKEPQYIYIFLIHKMVLLKNGKIEKKNQKGQKINKCEQQTVNQSNAKFCTFDYKIVQGTQGAVLYLQSVPVYEDIDQAGQTHRGIPMRKVASSFKYKMAQAICVQLEKQSIYTYILNQYTKLQKLKAADT